MDEQQRACANVGEGLEQEVAGEPKYCHKCGEKVDVADSFCPKCGNPIKNASRVRERFDLDRLSDTKAGVGRIPKVFMRKFKSLGKWTKTAIAVAVILLIACVVVFSIPNPREVCAINAAKSYKSMMKNPESMTIHGDVIVNDNGDTSDGYYVFIDVSGENGFGGTSRDVAMFTESGYVGSEDDEVDVDGYSSENEIDDALSKTLAALRYSDIQIGNVEESKYGYVDSEKVAKAVGAKYNE